jgi:hypothetical protein
VSYATQSGAHSPDRQMPIREFFNHRRKKGRRKQQQIRILGECRRR